ncbi:uncharacterized protein YbdG-like [Branchiostoma floridae x Branchiostoma japonicum]
MSSARKRRGQNSQTAKPHADKENNLPKGPVETFDPRRRAKPRSWLSRCMNIAKYILFALFLPPFLNYTALLREQEIMQPEGDFVDIGEGQKMFINCKGRGAPSVLMDAGTGMTSDVWEIIQLELAKSTRVCVYDRAGLGYSDVPPPGVESRSQPHTIERMADNLHQVLQQKKEIKKPLILVGAEIGALVTRFYAQMHDVDILGLVQIEPLVENLFLVDGGVWVQYWYHQLLMSLQALQFSAAIGFTRFALIVGMVDQPIAGELTSSSVQIRQKYLLCQPRHLSAAVDEHYFINSSFSQISTLWTMKSFPKNISVTVINGNYYDEQLPPELNRAWAKAQQHLISNVHPGCKHIVVNGADRHMLYKSPSSVVNPVLRLVRQWKHSNREAKRQ